MRASAESTEARKIIDRQESIARSGVFIAPLPSQEIVRRAANFLP
jgi:hypothetical protein